MERLCPERWRLPQHRTCLNWEVAEQTNWELSRRSCDAIQLVDLCELWIFLLVCAGAVFTAAKDVEQSNGPTHGKRTFLLSVYLCQTLPWTLGAFRGGRLWQPALALTSVIEGRRPSASAP